LSYALDLADKGLRKALQENSALQRGVNVIAGRVTHAGVAAAFGLPHTAIEQLYG
jgi:alanine dehydrogenase